MFPSKDTVKLFIDICSRDGLSKTVSEVIKNPIDEKYGPVLSYLKGAMRIIDNPEGTSDLCGESFGVGFLTCFNLFRLQLESEDMDIDDLQTNLDNLNNYIQFLEEENSKLKNG